MKRKQFWIIGGGLAVVLIGGLSLAGMKDKGLAVQVATVGRENLQSKVSANSKIQAVTKADISASIMGQVTRPVRTPLPAVAATMGPAARRANRNGRA